MVYGAIDLHARYSQIRIIDAEGRVLRERRVRDDRASAWSAAFAGHGPMRILLETGTESEWVAQALEGAGHEVIVADPNFAPMYGEIRRKVKTDRRDVAALAEANRRGWYRATHRVSAAQRAVRQVLRSRRQLVQMRSRHDLVDARAAAARRAIGWRRGAAERVPARLARLALPPALAETLRRCGGWSRRLTTEIAGVDARLRDRTRRRIRWCSGCRPCRASGRSWR